MSSIDKLNNTWNSVYNNKNLSVVDISTLKSVIKEDKKVSAEEIAFLESKLNTLAPEDKKNLSKLITSLKVIKDVKEFSPSGMSFKIPIDANTLQNEIKNIQSLLVKNKPEACKKMNALVEKVKKECPENQELIDNLKLGLASIYIESNDSKAVPLLKEIQKNPKLKEQSMLMEMQFYVKLGDISKVMPLISELSKSENTEVSSLANNIRQDLESKYLDIISKAAQNNIDVLNQIKENKTPQSMSSLLNPLTSVKLIAGHYDNLQVIHDSNISSLIDLKDGVTFAKIAIKNSGKSLADLSKMSIKDMTTICKIPKEYAVIIKDYIQSNPDFKKVASSDFSENFSWDKNKPYITPEYLDTEWDIAAKWIGDQVRTARETDEVLKNSSSLIDRAIGHTSGAILDTISDGNQLAKMLIKDAHDFYSQQEASGTSFGYLAGKTGKAFTTLGEIVSSPVTSVTTQLDHKATDEERAEALKDIALTYGTLGVAKAGAPAWKTLGAGASKMAKPVNDLVLKGMNKTVDASRFVLNKVTADKLVRTTAQLKKASAEIAKKIEQGFDDILAKNSKALESKGFTVPKNMKEFEALALKDPIKAQNLITNAVIEDATVKKGLSKILQQAKKGLSPEQLKNFDDFKAIQDYMVKNPDKFYDEFGGFATTHFSKGLSTQQLKDAGFEYFSHYTNQKALPKILSSGKILEQKWDLISGTLSNLTSDMAKGLLKPEQFVDKLKKIIGETRSFGFRGYEPLNLKSLTKADMTVASLNTSKTPEAVINVLVPSSKMNASHGWKKIVQSTSQVNHNIGTIRGGVDLFPKSVSQGIMSEAERKILIKGLDYQGTVPPEIINAIAVGTGGGIVLGAEATWEVLIDALSSK